MLKINCSTAVAIIAIAAFSVWSFTVTDALAQHMHQHNAHGGQQHPGLAPAGTEAAPTAKRTPHGGQTSVAGPFQCEVVYRPQEVRVYLYDASNRPVSTRGIAGQAAMTVRGYEKVYRYPLQYVPPAAGSPTHDYLGLTIDLSRMKDGDMSVAFELTDLPGGQQPRATFSQTFALSKAPIQVAVVALTEADRAGIARQQVCAVSGGRLGSMGTPIKMLVGNQPVYLCCKGCIGKVQQNPEAYLPKATPTQSVWTCPMHPQVRLAKQGKCPICDMNLIAATNESRSPAEHAASPQPGTAVADQMTVSNATAADQAAIGAQRVCAVAGSRLGGMGTPVKVTINGQSLFLCCKGCLGKVRKNPGLYFAKAAELRAGQ